MYRYMYIVCWPSKFEDNNRGRWQKEIGWIHVKIYDVGKIQHCPYDISFDFYMANYGKPCFNGIILTSSGIKSLVQEFTIPFIKMKISTVSLPNLLNIHIILHVYS